MSPHLQEVCFTISEEGLQVSPLSKNKNSWADLKTGTEQL